MGINFQWTTHFTPNRKGLVSLTDVGDNDGADLPRAELRTRIKLEISFLVDAGEPLPIRNECCNWYDIFRWCMTGVNEPLKSCPTDTADADLKRPPLLPPLPTAPPPPRKCSFRNVGGVNDFMSWDLTGQLFVGLLLAFCCSFALRMTTDSLLVQLLFVLLPLLFDCFDCFILSSRVCRYLLFVCRLTRKLYNTQNYS